MKRIFFLILITLFIFIFGMYALSPIRPRAWEPSDSLRFVKDEKKLRSHSIIDLAPYIAHEDSAVGPDGALYTGATHPSNNSAGIFRVSPGVVKADLWLKVERGSIAGLKFDKTGSLWACNPTEGLLKINLNTKEVENILKQAEGIPFGLLNDLDIAIDGTIYLSDSSLRKPFHIRNELIEAVPTGRLISFNKQNETKVLLDELFWPNGILVSLDQNYLLFTEMGYYRIWKYWIRGDLAGKKELWLDNLPGFPNGLTYSRSGSVLVGLIANRSHLLDAIHPFPFIKRIFGSVPEFLQPKQSNTGRLLEFSVEGRLLNSWVDSGAGSVQEVSSAEIWGDYYVLGSDRQTYLPIVKLDD